MQPHEGGRDCEECKREEVAVIFSPANMFAKRRMVNDNGRREVADQFDGHHNDEQSRHGASEVHQIPTDTLGSKSPSNGSRGIR